MATGIHGPVTKWRTTDGPALVSVPRATRWPQQRELPLSWQQIEHSALGDALTQAFSLGSVKSPTARCISSVVGNGAPSAAAKAVPASTTPAARIRSTPKVRNLPSTAFMGTPYLPTLRSTLIHINLAGERTQSNEEYRHAKDGRPKDKCTIFVDDCQPRSKGKAGHPTCHFWAMALVGRSLRLNLATASKTVKLSARERSQNREAIGGKHFARVEGGRPSLLVSHKFVR